MHIKSKHLSVEIVLSHYLPRKCGSIFLRWLAIIHFIDESCTAKYSGTVSAFLVWWDLEMEPTDATQRISMAPKWMFKSTPKHKYAWREHWMQSIYYPTHQLEIKAGESFFIKYSHESLSMWFDIGKSTQPLEFTEENNPIALPHCSCGVHMAYPRHRLAIFNSHMYRKRQKHLLKVIQEKLKAIDVGEKANLIFVSDDCFIPFLLESFISKEILEKVDACFVFDTNPLSHKLLSEYSAHSSLSIQMQFSDLEASLSNPSFIDDLKGRQNIVISEPYSDCSAVPWEQLHAWYAVSKLRNCVQDYQSPVCLLSPSSIRIWAVGVDFENLYKIRHPLGTNCEGFDMTHFDDLIMTACRRTDSPIESHPLWEYPNRARSQITKVFEFDFSSNMCEYENDSDPKLKNSDSLCVYQSQLELSKDGLTNGIAFWVEWGIKMPSTGEISWFSSGGPCSDNGEVELESININEKLNWNCLGEHQGVLLFYNELIEAVKNCPNRILKLESHLNVPLGEISFNIDIQ